MKTSFNSFINEKSGLEFLGYHSSKQKLSGFNSFDYNDSNFERVREVFLYAVPTSTPDYQKALNDIDMMLEIIDDLGICVTFLSEEPIQSSNFQSSRYKYGNNLYKVYGKKIIGILDDYFEINAIMVIYYQKNPLYFEKYED